MRATFRPRTRQRGATLVMALILLVVVMLFGITAMSSGIMNLRIARNVQLAAEAQNAAQRVIDTKISSLTTFTSPAAAAGTTTIDATGGSNTYSVTFDQPSCYSLRPAPGYSYPPPGGVNIAPKDSTWRLVSTATDTSTGATIQVRQGVKVRLPTNATCP